jgi:hypothetical protein
VRRWDRLGRRDRVLMILLLPMAVALVVGGFLPGHRGWWGPLMALTSLLVVYLWFKGNTD